MVYLGDNHAANIPGLRLIARRNFHPDEVVTVMVWHSTRTAWAA
jgi:hypothetical protein